MRSGGESDADRPRNPRADVFGGPSGLYRPDALTDAARIGARAPVCARHSAHWAAMLLALVLAPAYAGVPLTVEVHGVNGRLRTNVSAFLSLEQQKDNPRLTGDTALRCHSSAGALHREIE